jgi:hypothetical protein
MRTCFVISLLLVAALASFAGCAGGSERTGDDASGALEQTTAGSSPSADLSPFDDMAGQQSKPSLTAAEEKVSRVERARVLVAARRVAAALDRWDARVAACATDAWTSCLSRPRTRLLVSLLGVERLLSRDESARDGPCRAGVRSAYDAVYGFRLSQARADYSDPAPGTAAGDPDLAILELAVNALRSVPAVLESLAATVCER